MFLWLPSLPQLTLFRNVTSFRCWLWLLGARSKIQTTKLALRVSVIAPEKLLNMYMKIRHQVNVLPLSKFGMFFFFSVSELSAEAGDRFFR